VRRVLAWTALAAAAALILVLAQKHRDLSRAYIELRRRATLLHAGDVVPTFSASTLDGRRVTIGATTAPEARQVLFILRTTCPYCRATLPVWERLADSLRRVTTPPIELYAISLDSAESTRAYARLHHLSYPVLLFPEPKLERLYRVGAVPQTVVLDNAGRVLYATTGLLDRSGVLDSVFQAATAPRPRGRGAPLRPAAPVARGRGG